MTVKLKHIFSSMLVSVLIVFLGTIYLNLDFYNSQFEKYYRKENSKTAVVISKILAHPLEISDYHRVKIMVDNLAQTGNISSVTVTNTFNDIVGYWKTIETDRTDFYSVKYSIISNNTLEKIGNLEINFKKSTLRPIVEKYFLIIIMTFGVGSVFILSQLLLVYQVIGRFIDGITSKLNQLSTNKAKASKTKYFINDFNSIELSYNRSVAEMSNLKVKENEYTKQKERFQIAHQVAHDIKSPLAALDMVINEISTIPEQLRIIVRSSVARIHDIANDLVIKNKDHIHNQNNCSSACNSSVLLVDIIESIVTEKRIQFRANRNILINFDIGASAYGIFTTINVIEFQRMLSNIINNSIESFFHNHGVINIFLQSIDQKKINLTIEDNGRGIPLDLMNEIGSRGKSFNKHGGSGLGLYHAKRTIKAIGGHLEIQSKENVGTKIILTLLKDPVPSYFPLELVVKPTDRIVILDDDDSIHQVWTRRIVPKVSENNIIHFTCPDSFLKWKLNNTASLYLIDYEFQNYKINGLDVILQAEICKDSILVTSHYENEIIRNSCRKNDIKLLPKGSASIIPVKIKFPLKNCNQNITAPTYILLDDDDLVRLTWEVKASEKGINLITFSNKEDLFSSLSSINLESNFYIDSCLEDNIKGEDVAKELFTLGYKNLYLSTGYRPEAFKNHNFLMGVQGKDFPVSTN